jgi:hypothetical protein
MDSNFLRLASDSFESLLRTDCTPGFPDIPSALTAVRAFRGDPARMAILRGRIARRFHGAHRLSDEAVLRHFASLLVCERFKLPRSEHTGSVAEDAAEALEAKNQQQAAGAAGITAMKTTWVEFRVLDDGTGQPVEGVELIIRLPDGRTERRTTDAGGFVEYNDTLDGECRVSCDLSDARLPATFNFVRMG